MVRALLHAGLLVLRQRRATQAGEIIVIATGADFPVPNLGLPYDHVSMTVEEVLVPMAIWSAVQ